MAQAQPDSQPPVQGAPKTSLPVVSLIFGILSFIQCIPVIGAIVAIITGVIGRKRAREYGQSTTSATAGLWLGIIGLLISIVVTAALVATGFTFFGLVAQQTKVAESLQPAQTAAEDYGAANGTYNGISATGLEEFGFIPDPEVTVEAVATNGGNSFCIEGYEVAKPDVVVHVPPTANEPTVSVSINGVEVRYATGPCPTS